MRVCIDQSKCHTHGICVKELPQIFRFETGSKKAVVFVNEIPRELEKKVCRVAEKCPVKAIQVFA